jgi:hypothetical protein
VTIAYDTLNQRFNATWTASTGADRYRVLLKRTSADAFETLNDSISLFTPAYNFTTGFTVEWAAARLRVEACNAAGCTAAPELPLLPYQANAIVQKNYQKADALQKIIVDAGYRSLQININELSACAWCQLLILFMTSNCRQVPNLSGDQVLAKKYRVRLRFVSLLVLNV